MLMSALVLAASCALIGSIQGDYGVGVGNKGGGGSGGAGGTALGGGGVGGVGGVGGSGAVGGFALRPATLHKRTTVQHQR